MCSPVISANDTAPETAWLAAGANRPTTASMADSTRWARAGSPTQPSASDAMVMPSWQAAM